MSNPPIILDRRPIDELDALNPDDPLFVESIVALYERDTEMRLAEIESGIADGDVTRVTEAAHGLKGASRTIGAVEMGDVCERIERLGRLPEPSEVSEVHEAFARARSSLRALL